MVEMTVGTCNGHGDLDDEEVPGRWDVTPGSYMSLLPAFLPLPATRCSPPVPYWPGEPLAGLQGVLQGAEALGPA